MGLLGAKAGFYQPLATAGDADVEALIAAAGLSDQTDLDYVNYIIPELKLNSLWDRWTALYMFPGSTETHNKYNAKNPGVFTLGFTGGWVHDNSGSDPDGSTGSADTQVIPATHLTENDTTIGVYINEDANSASVEIGCFADPARLALYIRYGGGSFTYSDHYNFGTQRIGTDGIGNLGFHLATRAASNDHRLFRNGVQLGATNTGLSSDFSGLNVSIKLGGFAGVFSSRRMCFAPIGGSVTPAEALTLHNIVQTAQTIKGRQV